MHTHIHHHLSQICILSVHTFLALVVLITQMKALLEV